MKFPINILSLGAGVQSSWLLKMAESGELGILIVAAIFADTQREPESVYKWVAFLKATTKIPIIVITRGDLGEGALVVKTSKKSGRKWMKGLIPAFVLNEDGSIGLMGRKCTLDFKVEPIIKETRRIVGRETLNAWRKKHASACAMIREYRQELARRNKLKLGPPPFPHDAWKECQDDALVIQHIGISVDEADRAKPSRIEWIRNAFPLLEHNLTRTNCAEKLAEINLKAPRSACVFCPFHGDEEWLRLKTDEPNDFEKAAKFEDELQAAARSQQVLRGTPFLHGSCKPLRTINFAARKMPKLYQQSLFGNECTGMCGV